MKRISFLLVVFLLIGCQSIATKSVNTTSPEPPSSKTSTSPETSSKEWTDTFIYEHIQFNTTQELLDYLKQNSTEKEIKGAEIQNFVKDNQITIYEPTFTPPDGFHLSSVEIWTIYGAYTYLTDDLIDYLDKIRSSALAAVESISHPTSSYLTKVEDSIPSEKSSSSEESSLSDTVDDSIFRAENSIILQWSTEKSETPGAALAWIIKSSALRPLGNDENPKFYYSANDPSGTPVSYTVYWETDGYLCFASFPAALFSEENVAKICSFKPVTVPLG